MAEFEDVEKVEIVGETSVDKDALFGALREVYDPEIPVNIVDLGLVYHITLEGSKVDVLMTLTSIGCPVGPEVMADVEQHVREVAGVEDVEVTLTYDPMWTPDRMTEDAKWELGIS